MADYRPETCAYCQTDTWCEIRANGKPQCRACKVERFFETVLYAPLGFRLLDWQRKVLRDLYGTVQAETGLRQYRIGFVSMAKKQGKSFLIGGLPIYHLLMENEVRPEAYGAAAAKDQAGIVFKAAAQFVKANPVLSERIKLLESTKRMLRRDGGGSYAVLSADGDVQDGIEPSLAVLDELHRWKTAKADTLYDVITKGVISRHEPLVVEVTTAGEQYESPLWFREHEHARQILDGSLKSDRFYAAIWSADAKRLETDADYWKSREARVAANPSHEDHGGFLKDEALVAEMEKAIANPAQRPKYLRYNLNVPVISGEQRAIEMPRWYECGGGVDLQSWSVYDPKLLIEEWGLKDRACWAGVDASWTIDLTALSLVFPPVGEEPWSIICFFWMPAERVAERERSDRVPYAHWAERKFIEATPGNAVDQNAVKERIRWAAKQFELREVAFDPWNFRTSASDLLGEGLQCIEIRQGYALLSEPTKRLLELYLDRKIRHGNHPVLNWNASCLSLQGDHKDNVQPTKPERGKSSKRIDGISATVTALARAMANPPKSQSVYETRGVLYL